MNRTPRSSKNTFCRTVKEAPHGTRQTGRYHPRPAQEDRRYGGRISWPRQDQFPHRDREGREGPALCLSRPARAQAQLPGPVDPADQCRRSRTRDHLFPVHQRHQARGHHHGSQDPGRSLLPGTSGFRCPGETGDRCPRKIRDLIQMRVLSRAAAVIAVALLTAWGGYNSDIDAVKKAEAPPGTTNEAWVNDIAGARGHVDWSAGKAAAYNNDDIVE